MHVFQRHWLKMIAAISILVFFVVANRMYLEIDPNRIREWILTWGWWAPFIFVLMLIVRPFTLFPASLLAIAGGLAFGVWAGLIYTWGASLAGAVASFWVARKLGTSIVKKDWPGYTRKIQEQLEKSGFFYVLIIRLMPLLNFDMVTYLSAISRVRFRDFFLATLIGIFPGAFAFVFLGSSVATGQYHMVMFAVVILLTVIAIPIWLRKRYLHQMKH